MARKQSGLPTLTKGQARYSFPPRANKRRRFLSPPREAILAPTKSPSRKSSAKGAPQGARSSKASVDVVIETSGESIEDDASEDSDADEVENPAADEEFEPDENQDDDLSESEAYESVDEDDADNADDTDDTDEHSTALSLPASKSKALATRDPLSVYMREVQSHPLLSREEETELAIRYAEKGDVDAAARLVTANLRLVVKLAYEYRRAHKNMMDLIQEGNMGLMQAVKKYDPYRGVKLSSYAAWWIRAYMLRYILANWRMVKLGTTQAQRKLFFNLNKEKARLSALGIEPTSGEVAKRLDVTEMEVEEMDKRLARSDASLDTPVNEGEGRQIARVELMPAEGIAPDVATESAELGHLLRTHLGEFRKDLHGKELTIFDERLVADDPRTLQDLGDQFGVSRERVRQLEARMTGRLREYLSARIGDPESLRG